MSRYTLGPGVVEDLKEISHYIARDKPGAAKRLRGRFLDQFRLLSRNPLMGEARDDLAPDIGMISVGNYVVLFRPVDNGVEIVQIVHAARDLPSVFRRPN